MKKFFYLAAFSFLIITGCLDTLNKYDEVVINKEFTIKIGDSVFVEQPGIFIKFNKVEDDSRCPIGAVCIWEGNATVVLGLKNSSGDLRDVKLNTSIDPRNVNYSNLTITLKDLLPYPILDSVINPKDYVASLLVKNKEN